MSDVIYEFKSHCSDTPIHNRPIANKVIDEKCELNYVFQRQWMAVRIAAGGYLFQVVVVPDLGTLVSAGRHAKQALINGRGRHCDKRYEPCDADRAAGVPACLPAQRRQRATDGEIAFHRNGDQREHRHADRHACIYTSTNSPSEP